MQILQPCNFHKILVLLKMFYQFQVTRLIGPMIMARRAYVCVSNVQNLVQTCIFPTKLAQMMSKVFGFILNAYYFSFLYEVFISFF